MSASPNAKATTSPLALTLAMVSLLEDQVNLGFVALSGTILAVNLYVLPFSKADSPLTLIPVTFMYSSI